MVREETCVVGKSFREDVQLVWVKSVEKKSLVLKVWDGLTEDYLMRLNDTHHRKHLHHRHKLVYSTL